MKHSAKSLAGKKAYLLILLFSFLFTACEDLLSLSDGGFSSLDSANQCLELGPEVNCQKVAKYKVLMQDSFTRQTVVPEFLDELIGWRKIIDDYGRIVADSGSNHVNAEITSEDDMGPAAEGSKYLTFYGRQGHSVHNIYLVTETLDVSSIFNSANVATVRFKYLPIHLESGEYLKLEICNQTADDCGVGQDITMAELNGSHWKTIFSTSNDDLGKNYDGYNHSHNDYSTAHIPIFLEDLQKQNFVIRFNVRIDEGFIGNQRANGLEDGILLDEIQINLLEVPEVDHEGDEDLDDLIF